MFRFYSDPESPNRVSVVGQHSEGVLKIAVSRCSNKDIFVKKKGRFIAEGRLAKGRYYKVIEKPTMEISEWIEIAKQVASEVSINKQTITK